ncbi:MAG: sigma-70 family RNA polymerase sigma factor [Candidatus Dormibacteria bacterium]
MAETYAASRAVRVPVRTASPTDPEVARQRTPFDALFESEYGRVVAIAARILGDRQEAEDVAQDVFLQLHRRRDVSAPYAPAWLHAAAAHSALNVIRSRRRRAHREQRWAADPPRSDDPAEAVALAETRRQVRLALSRIRRRHATVLALRHGGLSYAELAEALGVRISHVGTMLRRAETALRKEIGDAPL